MNKIAIIGAGSWGTAIALNLARNSRQEIMLYSNDATQVENLKKDNCNKVFLPTHQFPNNLKISGEIEDLTSANAIIIAVPSFAFRPVLKEIQPYINKQEICWATKGFDPETNDLLSATFEQFFPNKDFAIIAGPSFAKEVADGKPTAITIASKNLKLAERFAEYMNNENMVLYTTNDIISAQIGAALKNVIAIATGISDGLEFGANARAGLITRGLHEMTRLTKAVGGKSETLMGLSGLGDLILTCTDDQSRNRRFGKLLGQGRTPEEAVKEIKQTIEGIQATFEAIKFAEKYKIRLPLTEILGHILKGSASPENAMRLFLKSEPKLEIK